MPTPTVADIDRIAALTDPVVRNLQITQCYYELSARLIERTGPAANWCTYATWASKQAGQTIRKADLGQTLKRVVTSPPALNNVGPMPGALVAPAAADDPVAAANTTLWELLDPTAPFDRASEAVARGNRKVFAEIGRVFAAFAGACLDDETPDDAKIAAFCAALRPGPPPDGQEYLRRAFARYYAALFTADAKARAEHLYFANLAIGFHEQTRLQPEIVAALDAPIPDASRVARQLGAALLPYPRLLALPWLYLRRLLGRPLLVEQVAAAAVARARSAAHLIVTEHLMTITLAGGAYLRLGRDLKAPYPTTLARIDDGELAALLATVDPTPDAVTASGADNWGDLAERLHFIADMFRCYQESPLLFEPPFAPDQVAVLGAGQVPDGAL
jgi:hypothetical protein